MVYAQLLDAIYFVFQQAKFWEGYVNSHGKFFVFFKCIFHFIDIDKNMDIEHLEYIFK